MFNRRLLVSTSGGVVVGPPATLEFDIDQPGGSSLPGATITISYNGETVTKTSDNKGLAVFYEVPTNIDIPYTVTASGYEDYTGSVNIAPGDYGWVNVEMSKLQPQGNYSLLVGSFGDASGTLWRGYFTKKSTKGAITPSNYAGYPIKSCYIQLMTDEQVGLISINVFIVELEGDSRNDITSLVLKINGIDYTLGINGYSYGNTQYYILLSDNGALFYYLDANINKSVDIEITSP